VEADAIELPSLPWAINGDWIEYSRDLSPSVGAAILLRPFSVNTLISLPSHLCKNMTPTPQCLTNLFSISKLWYTIIVHGVQQGENEHEH